MRKRDPPRRETEKIVRKDTEQQLRKVHKFTWLLHSFDRGHRVDSATIVSDDGSPLILEVDRGPGKKKHKFCLTVKAERIP